MLRLIWFDSHHYEGISLAQTWADLTMCSQKERNRKVSLLTARLVLRQSWSIRVTTVVARQLTMPSIGGQLS